MRYMYGVGWLQEMFIHIQSNKDKFVCHLLLCGVYILFFGILSLLLCCPLLSVVMVLKLFLCLIGYWHQGIRDQSFLVLAIM